MSTPAHIWFCDETSSPVVGECMMPTRLGSIEMRSFSHNIWIPTDYNTGKLTGTRLHQPITFEKEFDKVTPVLYRALCQGRVLKTATIKMYKINEAGIELEYFNINLENIKITNISPILFPLGNVSTHIERIEMRYESIEWKHCDGNVIFKDAWNERACA